MIHYQRVTYSKHSAVKEQHYQPYVPFSLRRIWSSHALTIEIPPCRSTCHRHPTSAAHPHHSSSTGQPKFTQTTLLLSLVTSGCPHPFQNIGICEQTRSRLHPGNGQTIRPCTLTPLCIRQSACCYITGSSTLNKIPTF